MGCHSSDTQVLTPEGIKDWKEIKAGDKVFGIDKEMNLMENEVIEVLKFDYEGEMLRFYNRLFFDMLVTPNHNMIIKTSNSFDYIRADLVNINEKIPSFFNWNGQQQTISIEGNEFNTDDLIKLLSWYITDGYFLTCKKGKYKYIQIRKGKHKKEIHELLKRMGLKYGFYENSKFVIFNLPLSKYVETNCGVGAINKRIPKDILQLPKDKLKIFFNNMMKGDGCRYGSNLRYYTSSKGLAKDFIELCLKIGFHANIKNRGKRRGGYINGRFIEAKNDCLEIGIQRIENTKIKKIEKIHYKGTVWCLTTKLGNFITIRNGIVSISGNSGKTLTATHLGFKNWYFKRHKIFSNYHLYKIPYYYLESVRQLDFPRDGVVLLDEIWRILDSRFSRKTSNKFVGDILAKSRKRHLIYIFTAQVIDTIDKRIRKVMDFTNLPFSNRKETTIKVLVFRSGYPKGGNYLKTFYYNTEIPKMLYCTEEEVDMIDDSAEPSVNPPKLMWQTSRYICNDCNYEEVREIGKCTNCGSPNLKPADTIYFKSWEEADNYGSEYWQKWFAENRIVSK